MGKMDMATDRQAINLLQSVEEVTELLEQGRHALSRYAGDARRRHQLQGRLLVDMERLNNLLHLVEQQPVKGLTDETRHMIDETLGEVRQKASKIAIDLALRRIHALQRLADRASRRKEHPLGKSFELRDSFLNSLNMLHALGANLTAQHQETVANTAATINELILRDRSEALLQALGDEDPCPLIDLKEVNFSVPQVA